MVRLTTFFYSVGLVTMLEALYIVGHTMMYLPVLWYIRPGRTVGLNDQWRRNRSGRSGFGRYTFKAVN